jgi:hypothetical protein
MTTDTVRRWERELRCVRCGLRPRSAETFLCASCLGDPDAHLETARALELANGDAARRLVIERYGWAGGWRVRARA